MTDKPKNPFESLEKIMLDFQQTAKPIIEFHDALNESMKPYVTLAASIQKRLEVLSKQFEPYAKLVKTITEYVEQLRQNFRDVLSTLDPPETYDPSKIQLNENIDRMVLRMVYFAQDIETRPFGHLQERMLIGIDAHVQKNYHLSLFCIFSVIDGMLTWFYHENFHTPKHLSMDQKLKKLFDACGFEHVVQTKEIRSRFEIFVKHRNQIMHGDEHSHFDKNLSTAALLFLGIVYHSIVNT